VSSEEFPDWSEIEFHCRNWVLELEVLQNLWMEHSNGADLFAGENDISSSSWEELEILALFNREIFVQNSSDLGHEQTESTMDHLERPCGIQLHDTDLSVVLASGISGHIDHSDITHLEDLLGNSLVLIRIQSLEKTWDQRGSNLLILQGFWIGQSNCLVHVWNVSEVSVILFD
jgi:hypothetical protein